MDIRKNVNQLSGISFFLIIGTFALAVIDKDMRVPFSDLAKVGVGGYIGYLMPKNNFRK